MQKTLDLKQIMAKIKKENICISDAYAIASCSTCGCMEAEKLIKKIDNVENELIMLDIEEIIGDTKFFTTYRDMPRELQIIIFIFYRIDFDKKQVLEYWLKNLPDKCLKFYDALTYYVIRKNLTGEELKENWIVRCKELIKKYNDGSLMKSLKYIDKNYNLHPNE